MSFTEQGMPTHQDLIVPVLRAVKSIGGSAKSREIIDEVLAVYPSADELRQVTYPNRPNVSVLEDRITWGRSTAKLIGALEQPNRGIYLTTDLADELLNLPGDQALLRIKELDREYYLRKRKEKQQENSEPVPIPDPADDAPSEDVVADIEAEEDTVTDWKEQLLNRLHQLTPEGFEKFVLYLLRKYGLQLTHIGGTADEGIDGIGTAPLSPVLSSRVAVQIKRYAPNGKPIGREVVALFQRDAQTKGAERAILVTLSRFTEPARKAATSATPTVDLIDGERLADLVHQDGESGVRLEPTVNEKWFDRFD